MIWKEHFMRCIAGAKRSPAGPVASGGACGAGISTGQFLSIATESTPLAAEPWGLSNQMTARALENIGKAGGPRCCKRDSFLAILAAVDFVREHLGVEMKRTVPVCSYSSRNNQCIGRRCPFSAAGRKKPRVAFLCVHNSCRSQIAEALDKELARDVFESFSAGTEPGAQINPESLNVQRLRAYCRHLGRCSSSRSIKVMAMVKAWMRRLARVIWD